MSELDELAAIEKRAAEHEKRYPWRYLPEAKDFLAKDRKALVARVREAEAEVVKITANRDDWASRMMELASVTQRAERAEAVIADIEALLNSKPGETLTWWEWIRDGLGGSLHDDLRAIFDRYENGADDA